MKIVGVIPARWASTRFEGKILADIDGKPMIQHVWERASKSVLLDEVIIACDEQKVFEIVEAFGAKAVLTSKEHSSGTDRIAEVVESMDVDIVVNIQGDEPLIHSSVIDVLVQALIDDKSSSMATVIKRLDDQAEFANPNVVKVVVDGEMNALYFSRAAIPYNRDGVEVQCYKHLGIYAYRKDLLLAYKDLPRSNLEKAEQLEQLRALEFGYKIKTVLTDMETIGVDTPEDLERVRGGMFK